MVISLFTGVQTGMQKDCPPHLPILFSMSKCLSTVVPVNRSYSILYPEVKLPKKGQRRYDQFIALSFSPSIGQRGSKPGEMICAVIMSKDCILSTILYEKPQHNFSQ